MNTGHFAGRIGRDAELRYTQSGKQVAGFSLAVDERRGGEKSTLWIDCSIWGERAEKLAGYLSKGTSVAVAGEVGVRTYEKRDGGMTASLTLNVRELTLLGGGGEREERPARAPVRADEPLEDEIPF